jgi:hypothetical protein
MVEGESHNGNHVLQETAIEFGDIKRETGG